MGKIFEALYGAQQEAGSADAELANNDKGLPAEEEHPACTGADGTAMPAEPVKYIGKPLNNPPNTGEKWNRDLRKVATNLVVAMGAEGGEGGVVLFSGMSPQVGTTTVAESIATLLSFEGRQHRVLILDFSFCKDPVRNPDTLYSALSAGQDVSGFIESHCQQEVTRIIVGVTDDHSGMVQVSTQLRDFIQAAREHYDWILFDAPPFNQTPLSDSLGRIADAVVLVASSGVTRVPALNAIEEDMAQMGINLVGLVLNYRKYPLPKRLLRFL
ncbi:MAG: tyrosine-protein kinase family protein [Pontibacterium sp.]